MLQLTPSEQEFVLTQIEETTKKARFMLNDLKMAYFECFDPAHPPKEKYYTVTVDFEPIYYKISIIADLLEKINVILNPILS